MRDREQTYATIEAQDNARATSAAKAVAENVLSRPPSQNANVHGKPAHTRNDFNVPPSRGKLANTKTAITTRNHTMNLREGRVRLHSDKR